jgi:hypothetical protein
MNSKGILFSRYNINSRKDREETVNLDQKIETFKAEVKKSLFVKA